MLDGVDAVKVQDAPPERGEIAPKVTIPEGVLEVESPVTVAVQVEESPFQSRE